MDLSRASRMFFAGTMIAMGVIGLISGTFAPIWEPDATSVPGRQLLAYLCTFVSLACGGGLLSRRTTAPAALILFAYALVWTMAFKVPIIIRHPLVEVAYQSCSQNVVLIVAAWVLYRRSPTSLHSVSRTSLVEDPGLRIAYVFYGLALIAFGLAQFIYLYLTTPLVPSWLPEPVFWAYLTGSIYVACGVAIVIGLASRLAAAISAIQITLITLLVWTPIVMAGHMTTIHWEESIESWVLTACAWVVAMSFEGRPWFDRLNNRGPQPVAAAH